MSSFCSAKATHIFSAKNIKILYIEFAKTVNELTFNELVKLTTLWTTGPWCYGQPSVAQTTHVKNKFSWSKRCSNHWSWTVQYFRKRKLRSYQDREETSNISEQGSASVGDRNQISYDGFDIFTDTLGPVEEEGMGLYHTSKLTDKKKKKMLQSASGMCIVNRPHLWRLIIKYFLRSFSPFCWCKKGICQFLSKECAQYWLTA